MRHDDVDALLAIFADPVAMEHFPAVWTRDMVVAFVARNQERYARDGHSLWAVLRKDTGELIGDCGLARQELPTGPEIEVGYHFRRDQWGKGFATEAARACLRHGFEVLRAGRLISLIRPENHPSRRVAERNGLRPSGEVLWSGLPHLIYSISAAEWSNRS